MLQVLMSQLWITATLHTIFTWHCNFVPLSDESSKDTSKTCDDDSAASMGDDEEDGEDILKAFLNDQSRATFLPPKKTRKLRTEFSVIKEPSKHVKKGKTWL